MLEKLEKLEKMDGDFVPVLRILSLFVCSVYGVADFLEVVFLI